MPDEVGRPDSRSKLAFGASQEPCGILSTMFFEWWERVRGIDRWPEVRATIESVRSYSLPNIGSTSVVDPHPPRVVRMDKMLERMLIAYTTADGVHRTKRIWLLPCPSLFLLDPGDHFYVRYCPDKPERLYIRERTQGYFLFFVSSAILAIILAFSHRR
jgi:hypothetical protein